MAAQKEDVQRSVLGIEGLGISLTAVFVQPSYSRRWSCPVSGCHDHASDNADRCRSAARGCVAQVRVPRTELRHEYDFSRDLLQGSILALSLASPTMHAYCIPVLHGAGTPTPTETVTLSGIYDPGPRARGSLAKITIVDAEPNQPLLQAPRLVLYRRLRVAYVLRAFEAPCC